MKQYVRFHIGRAGRAGQLSFVNEDNFQELLKQCGPHATHKIDPVHALLDALYCFDLSEGRLDE